MQSAFFILIIYTKMEMFDNIKIYKKMKPVDTFKRIGKTAA